MLEKRQKSLLYTTGEASAELFLTRKMWSNLDLLKPDLKQRVENNRRKSNLVIPLLKLQLRQTAFVNYTGKN